MSSVQLTSEMKVVFAEESWDEFWPEGEILARAHWEETDGEHQLERPFRLNSAKLRALSLLGLFRIYTARKAGQLIGYWTWTLIDDIDSEGLVTGVMGAAYIVPIAPPTISYRLFERSLAELHLLGIRCFFLHHRLKGRGANGARFFRHFGAEPYRNQFILFLKD